jgi:hypothetical protein
MSPHDPWIPPLVIGILWLLLAAWFSGWRLLRARQGERWLLRRRERVLRVYHRLRDGRVYDPARNQDIARILERERGP